MDADRTGKPPIASRQTSPAPPAGDLGSTDLTAILFRRVPAEDLAPYDETARAALASSARAHLAERRPRGVAALRLGDLDLGPEGSRREFSVLEVVNDDMPFLLDSTLAELVGRGLEPKLVAHPILSVHRDASGALVLTLISDDNFSSLQRTVLLQFALD